VVFSYACHNTTSGNVHEGFYRYHQDWISRAWPPRKSRRGFRTQTRSI
jgi:hypothetical protein